MYGEVSSELVAMFLDRATEILYQVRIEGDPCRARVTYVSPQCERVTGYAPEEFQAHPERWFELVHPEDRDALKARTEAILASRTEGTRLYRLRNAEGDYRYIEDYVVPLFDRHRRMVGYQGLARDVTRLVEGEEERRRALEAVKNAERGEALGRLAAGIAHDFNNILTVILGFSEATQAEIGTDHPAAAGLSEIDSAVKRGAQLVRQLLAFSRRQAVEPQVMDISGHISALDALLRQAVSERIEVRLILESSPWRVFIDPSQVDQIVLNLVSNASDAMPDGGLVEILVSSVELTQSFCDVHLGAVMGEYVCLSVRDTGVGMSPEVVKHAFVPFFTTKPEGKGSGIGLASVFGIVKQNLGYVLIESEVGKGTTVRVYLRRH